MKKQVTLDEWLMARFKDLLQRASVIATKKDMPVVLYRQSVEESEHAMEEEVATITSRYVVVQVITHGGFIPPSFQQQFVFRIDEFPEWIMKRSKELFLKTLDNLEEELKYQT
ncbi:MAG: hypothetical protein ACE5JV_01655 [Nitrososphaerales archaeon]